MSLWQLEAYANPRSLIANFEAGCAKVVNGSLSDLKDLEYESLHNFYYKNLVSYDSLAHHDIDSMQSCKNRYESLRIYNNWLIPFMQFIWQSIGVGVVSVDEVQADLKQDFAKMLNYYLRWLMKKVPKFWP